jgi:universal stress protein A
MESNNYRHLLLAVDFEKESEPVVARAAQLRRLLGARLTLLHVIEYVAPTMDTLYLGYSGDMAMPDTVELEKELLAVAGRQMDALGEQLDVGVADRLVRIGSIGHVVDEVAVELAADLIVLGSHGRHGLLGLFGSTARTVLRHSTCDVLCVKIPEPEA